MKKRPESKNEDNDRASGVLFMFKELFETMHEVLDAIMEEYPVATPKKKQDLALAARHLERNEQ